MTDIIKAIRDYYENDYTAVANSGFPGYLSRILHKAIERKSRVDFNKRVLEIAAGQGEHVVNRSNIPFEYWITDINERLLEKAKLNLRNHKNFSQMKFKVADANKLPFLDEYFDQIIVTCFLHHTQDVLTTLSELKRVLKQKGKLVIYVSCDPGILNRVIRKLFIEPRAKRLIKMKYSEFIAVEHLRHFQSIQTLIGYTFAGSEIRATFYPFIVKSWNLNAFCIFEINFNQLTRNN